jgi:hypothetical protein
MALSPELLETLSTLLDALNSMGVSYVTEDGDELANARKLIARYWRSVQ